MQEGDDPTGKHATGEKRVLHPACEGLGNAVIVTHGLSNPPISYRFLQRPISMQKACRALRKRRKMMLLAIIAAQQQSAVLSAILKTYIMLVSPSALRVR